MKYLLLLLLLTGCGEMKELSNRIDSVEDDIYNIKQRIAALEFKLETTMFSVETFQSLLEAVDLSNDGAVQLLQVNLAILETSVTNTTAQLAVLNGYQHITAFINPCGDNPNKFDEVLLKVYNFDTSSYSLISSFSDNANGFNTRFSVLPVGGPYTTTDGDNCQFSVAADGFSIINQNHVF